MSTLQITLWTLNTNTRSKFGVVSSAGQLTSRMTAPAKSPGPSPPYQAATSTAKDRSSWAVPGA